MARRGSQQEMAWTTPGASRDRGTPAEYGGIQRISTATHVEDEAEQPAPELRRTLGQMSLTPKRSATAWRGCAERK